MQGRKPPTKELFRLSKALENGRITRERCFRGEVKFLTGGNRSPEAT